MCIAIMKSANKKISKSTLRRCYDANPDGAGFMYAEDKKLVVKKGYFTFKEFYKEYKPHGDKQALIHFRIKTHGPIDKDNCHPFLVNNSLGFIHNGIISGYGSNIKSDTIEFNESILQKIVSKHGNNSLFDDPMVELIENVIGYSKLVFLDRHGNYKIMNETKGNWSDGVWYSNGSWMKPKPVKANPNYLSYPYQRQASLPSNHHSIGDWVILNDDYAYGTGDKTHVITKGTWLEVSAYDDILNQYTLISADIRDPLVFSGIPQRTVDTWDDTETYNWNKTFDNAI